MKVVLSRKGFDSEYGRIASPILPDGRLISLPIPREQETRRYGDLRVDQGRTYGDLLSDLGARYTGRDTCHLDPDLRREAVPRPADWRPLSGHRKRPQAELRAHGVGPGDLFLFFGWFRHAAMLPSGRLGFVRGAPNMHVIFGYLQIEEVLPVSPSTRLPSWMDGHAHAGPHYRNSEGNTVYLSRRALSWDSRLAGAGPLHYAGELVLSREGGTRSEWALPASFRDLNITHARYCPEGGFFRTFIGQEFIIDEDPSVERWAEEVIRIGARR